MRALDCIDRNLSAAERTDFRGRGSGLFDFFVDELRFCSRHELYDEENCERDYQKIEDSLNEVAVVERGVSCLGSECGGRVLRGVKSRAVAENDEHILEAAAACYQTDERHDKVGDERSDYLAERAADYNADRHVNDISL